MALGAGFASKLGEGAIAGTMDVAFGTPEADNMMLGQDLTPSLAMGALVPGIAGAPARLKNAASLNMYGVNSPEAIFGAPVAGAAVGATIGRNGQPWRRRI